MNTSYYESPKTPSAAGAMQQPQSAGMALSKPDIVGDSIVLGAINQESEEERQRQEIIKELLASAVKAEDEYPEEEFLITIDGVGAFALKDLVSIKAKQKAGKTTMISILIAVMLCGQWNKLKRVLDHTPRIIYFDTEMKERDTWALYHKSLRLAGLPPKSVEGVHFINLRKLTYQECAETIEKCIKYLRPDIAFVDGVVDLICDFNNIEQSQALVRQHVNLAEQYNCCIVEVLHTNKSNDDHNMRGHMGTILAQKGSNTFECQKDKALNIVTVTCDDYRKKPVPSWSFGFDEHGIPFCADGIKQQSDEAQQADKERKQAEKKQKEENRRLAAVREILLPAGLAGMARKTLQEKMEEKLGLAHSAVSDTVKKLLESNILLPKGWNGGLILNETLQQ